MNTRLPLRFGVLASLLGLFFLSSIPVQATCGGGGGGGTGGAGPSGPVGNDKPEVYRVPWKIFPAGKTLPAKPEASLIVLWFPVDAKSSQSSDLLTSRTLTQAASLCVVDALVTPDNKDLTGKYNVAAGTETVVLTTADGTELGRVTPNAKGAFEVRAVERLLKTEIDARRKKFEEILKAAEAKAKAGDKNAIEDLHKVWDERCLFPALGKRAAKALKKLGVDVEKTALNQLGPDDLSDPDVANIHADVERILKAGLNAEIAARYEEAGRLYRQAAELDPADTTALRFLGEFYRHQTGEWDKAGRIFNRVLVQPADPIARAVALHGLGKMTIHSGRFKSGLALFERSLEAFPLAITYRNLAVYWYSEKEMEKATGYTRQAIALEPHDRYNQIFAAVYLAAAGKTDEALAIARQHEDLLEASYNLAAIWAQAGDRTKAMALLKRHFYEYERYDAVRSMEMKEAREDYMFASLHADPAFNELTKLAKNAWMVGNEFCSPDQLIPVTAPPGPRSM